MNMVVSEFQFWIGVILLLNGLAALANTVFRFNEISNFDREQFAIYMNKTKREGQLHVQMLTKMTEWTNASIIDLEILKCKKPNQKQLGLVLLQKSILDIVGGILLSSAGLSLYTVFDFLTF